MAGLRAGGYSPRAFGSFFSRALGQAKQTLGERPGLVRTWWAWFLVSLGLTTGLGVGMAATRASFPWTSLLGVAAWALMVGLWSRLHLGLVESQQRFGLANGLSLVRLAASGLLICPWLWRPTGEPAAWLAAGLIVGLALSDLLDGFLARRLSSESRLGAVMDPLADVVFLTALGIGLARAGSIESWLLVGLLMRYPGAALGALFLALAKGPLPIAPSLIGRLTTFGLACGLSLLGLAALLWPAVLSPPVVTAVGLGLGGLLAVGLAHLIIRAVRL